MLHAKSNILFGSALFALLATLAACGGEMPTVTKQEQAIYNGSQCDKSVFPSAVFVGRLSVYDGQQRLSTCTGTLIAPDVVLTAAHCVDHRMDNQQKAPDQMALFVTFNPDAKAAMENKDFIGARYFGYHPDFNMQMQAQYLGVHNDVALVFLERPVTNVLPAALITAEEASQIRVGAEVFMVGWGATSNAQEPSSGVRMCAKSEIYQVGSHETVIGSGATTKCKGDSGGPSYLGVQTHYQNKVRLVGVTSRGIGGSYSDTCSMSTDTNVVPYLSWIDSMMKEACQTGKRSWCQEAGILSPDYFFRQVPAQPAQPGQPLAPAAPGLSPAPAGSAQDGGCSVANGSQTGLLPLSAFAMFFILYRRNREANRR
jgi:hypothetical protein